MQVKQSGAPVKRPVRRFFLSVACYVVRLEMQKFKSTKKC